jgi:uncharacterized protein YqjF (DUF2071 family)
MQLRTIARDCAYLNWAVPVDLAPVLPRSLRYDVRPGEGGDYAFVSVLLFRLSGLHLRSVPLVRVSYPQMNVRVYVLDAAGLPSVLFLRMLVPFWVVPGSRYLARQPAEAAHLTYPEPSREGDAEAAWRWRVARTRRFEVAARMGTPQVGCGPRLGDWRSTVAFFRNRQRGYAEVGEKLRTVSTDQPTVDLWPLEVEIRRHGLLQECLPRVPAETWDRPHSAWLCPQIPFDFVLSTPQLHAFAGARVPAAG